MRRYPYRLPVAVFFISLGISSLIYTPFQCIMDLRLYMHKGLPHFEWWRVPPEMVLCKVWIWNVTNAEEFLNGTHDKLHMEDVGPYVFREKNVYKNVVHNSNSTLTYTVERTVEYLPEKNSLDPNATVIAPNLATLTMATYLQDFSFFVKAGANVLIRKYGAEPLIKTTALKYLTNLTEPLLGPAKMFAGNMIESTNMAVLDYVYGHYVNNVTVYLGPKYGHEKFFHINNFDGSETINFKDNCKVKFENASEPPLFPQFLTKDSVVGLWKSILCKTIYFHYHNETISNGMTQLRFEADKNSFNRTFPSDKDCYKGEGPLIPNGLIDMSSCFRGLPFAASFPHFFRADKDTYKKIKGMNPSKEKHDSFLLLEQYSGVLIGGSGKAQINLRIPKLSGYNERILRFSDMFLPFMWIEYEIEELPWHIQALMYFMTVFIPNTQLFLSLGFISVGLFFLYRFYLDVRGNIFERQFSAFYETENFLK